MNEDDFPADLKRRLTDAMNLYVGRGRRFSVQALADASGLPVGTVQDIKDGVYVPKAHALLRLFRVLPPAFADMVLELADLGGSVRLSAVAAPPSAASAIAEMSERVSLIAGHLADGKHDHREMLEEIPACRALIEVLSAYVARLERAAGQSAGGSAAP